MHAPVKKADKRGFTLVEMSVVLIVVGLLIATIFPALTALRQSAALSATDANLASLMRATAAFTQATGCLPCPTPATTSGVGFGVVRGDTAPTPILCLACPQPEGLVPYASLGIPPSMAKDGWGHWITMRVDPALTVPFGIIPPTALCTAADVSAGICTTAGVSQKGLCKAGLSKTGQINVTVKGGATTHAAVIFVSHGANGYGAFVANPRTASGGTIHRLQVTDGTTPSCSVGSEACNASFSTQFSDTDFGTSFDDRLLYMDRNSLISLLGAGICQTPW